MIQRKPSLLLLLESITLMLGLHPFCYAAHYFMADDRLDKAP